jgi:hypothetical protein
MVPLVVFGALAYLPVALRNGFFGVEPLFLFAPGLAPSWLAPDAAEVARFAAMAEWKDLFMTRPGPVTALFLPIFAFINGAYPTTNFDGFLDPFFVPALLVVPFLIRGRPVLRALVVYGVGFYVAWFFTAPLTRYLFPALPLLAYVTATALRAVIDWAKAAGRGFLGSTIKGLIFAFATVCLASIVLDHGALLGHAVPGFLGFETREYFERLSGAHAHRDVAEAIDALEAQSHVSVPPEDARVFYIFESRVYFLDRPYYNDPFYVNLVLLRDRAASGESPVEYLRDGHFRYVVTDFGRVPWLRNERNWNRWLNPYPEARRRLDTLLEFWNAEVEPLLIHRGRFGRIDLFEVPDRDAPSPSG